jgi:hypothetical protein
MTAIGMQMNFSTSSPDPGAVSRFYSLALHDVRLSGGSASEEMVSRVRSRFSGPLTVHLICDAPLAESRGLAAALKPQWESGRMEIVFHGTCHTSPAQSWKMLSWYHKHQAEYVLDSDALRDKTRERFAALREFLGGNAGLCPPCWLANRRNWDFLFSLKPLYVESLLFLNLGGKRHFSPLVSLGSPESGELRLLRVQARFFRALSLLLPNAGPRVILHPCDLTSSSFDFLLEQSRILESRGFKPVLQKHLFAGNSTPSGQRRAQ